MNLISTFLFCLWLNPPATEAAPCIINQMAHSGKSAHRVSFLLDREPRTFDLLHEQLRIRSQAPDSPELNLNLGVTYLNLADETRWEYLDQAIAYISKARSAQPKDPLVIMYLGRTMGARALNVKPSNLKRLSWAREGFKYMDQAVSLDSDCFYLRLLRGEAQLLAHPILRRGTRLDEDAKFVETFTHDTAYASLPNYQKARIQLFLGNYKEKRKKDSNQVQAHWRNAMTLAHGSPIGNEAKARMLGGFQSLGYDGEEEG